MKNITIAIADDHALLRKSISTFLKEIMGFDVLMQAANAQDLLEQLKQSEVLPDVCLLDYNMPGKNGAELAALLSKQYPKIKLAAYTSEHSALIDMIRNGCTAFFSKNGNPKELAAGIKELVNKGYYCTEWMQETVIAFIQNSHNK